MVVKRAGLSGCHSPISCKKQSLWVIYKVDIKEISLKQHVRTLTTMVLISMLAACASPPAETADEPPANNTTSTQKTDSDGFTRDIPTAFPDIKARRSHATASDLTTTDVTRK